VVASLRAEFVDTSPHEEERRDKEKEPSDKIFFCGNKSTPPARVVTELHRKDACFVTPPYLRMTGAISSSLSEAIISSCSLLHFTALILNP